MIQSVILLLMIWLLYSQDYFPATIYSGIAATNIISISMSQDPSVIVAACSNQFYVSRKDSSDNYILQIPSIIGLGDVIVIDITKDASIVATGLSTNIIRILNTAPSGNYVQNYTLNQATQQIQSLTFSDDKTLLLSGSRDSKARLYTLINGRYTISRILGDASAGTIITSVLISQANIYLFTSDSVGKIRIYLNSPVGYLLDQILTESIVQINSMDITGDKKLLISGDVDGAIRIYKRSLVSTNVYQYIISQTIDDLTDAIVSVSVNSNGSILTISDINNILRIFKLNNLDIYQLVSSEVVGRINKLSQTGEYLLTVLRDQLTVRRICSVIPFCTECYSGVFCTKCIDGYFADTYGSCNPCDTNCQTCNSLSNQCSSCSPTFFLNGTLQCQACYLGCKTCTGLGSSACSQCIDGYFFQSGSCIMCPSNCSTCFSSISCQTCSSTHYNSSGICLPCASPCNKCNNLTYCTGCISTYYLESPIVCSICQAPCVTCITPSSCTSCVSGYYYEGNCLKCPEYCLTCTNSSLCSSCDPLFTNVYHNGTTCVYCPFNCSSCTNQFSCSSCSQGFYLTATSCPKCPINCNSCTSASLCTSCSQQYTLLGNNCIKCPINCTTCLSNGTCLSCQKGYYLQNSKCVTCSMLGCVYCLSLNSCLLCRQGYGLVNSTCHHFQVDSDPYSYIKQIVLTYNQTLSLIITLVLLAIITALALLVYCWIIKSVDQPEQNNKSQQQNQGYNTEPKHLKSQANLLNNISQVMP